MTPETITLTDPKSRLVDKHFDVWLQLLSLSGGRRRASRSTCCGRPRISRREQSEASGSGIPLLFPFPGRIQGTEFTWEGKTYHLQPGDKFGNAISRVRAFPVVARGGADRAKRPVGVFQASIDDPSLLGCWPADFKITATYELVGNTLSSHFRLENPDPKYALPCGFGTHGTFASRSGELRRRVPGLHSCPPEMAAPGRCW